MASDDTDIMEGQRRSSRSMFPTIWQQEDNVLAGSKETAPIYSLRFGKAGLDEWKQYSHGLAPVGDGAYYVYFKSVLNETKAVIRDPEKLGAADCLVPIAFLVALGRNDVDWKSLDELREKVLAKKERDDAERRQKAADDVKLLNEMAKKAKELRKWKKENGSLLKPEDPDHGNLVKGEPPAPDKQEIEDAVTSMHDTADETEFIEDWKNNWFGLTPELKLPYGDYPCWVPVRNLDGALTFRTLAETEPRNYFISMDSARRFRAKWCRALSKVWETRKGQHTGQPPRWTDVPLREGLIVCLNVTDKSRISPEAFSSSVDTVNKMKREALPGMAQRWVVRIGDSATLGPQYRQISINPFNIYSTYIHEDDWQAYMLDLANGLHPAYACRPPVDRKKAEASDAMKKVLQSYSAIKTETLVGLNRPFNNTGVKYSKLSKTEISNLQKYDMMVDHYEKVGYGFRISSELNAQKIAKAVGTRKKEPDQKGVMGESAGVVATSIGWMNNNRVDKNAGQLKNNLYLAEWLHLAAFSWGGHLLTASYQGATSQMPYNLVLGTSETNSFMLRYEKAWQNLFTFEDELHDKVYGKEANVHGDLWIEVNRTSEANDCIELDICAFPNGGKIPQYKCSTLNLEDANNRLTADMRAVVEAYPFIAYSMAYEVTMTSHSFALNCKGAELAINFYPFRRPFFHRAESALDSLLFAELKRQAKEDAIEVVKGNKNDPKAAQKMEKILYKGKQSGKKGGGKQTHHVGSNNSQVGRVQQNAGNSSMIGAVQGDNIADQGHKGNQQGNQGQFNMSYPSQQPGNQYGNQYGNQGYQFSMFNPPSQQSGIQYGNQGQQFNMFNPSQQSGNQYGLQYGNQGHHQFNSGQPFNMLNPSQQYGNQGQQFNMFNPSQQSDNQYGNQERFNMFNPTQQPSMFATGKPGNNPIQGGNNLIKQRKQLLGPKKLGEGKLATKLNPTQKDVQFTMSDSQGAGFDGLKDGNYPSQTSEALGLGKQKAQRNTSKQMNQGRNAMLQGMQQGRNKLVSSIRAGRNATFDLQRAQDIHALDTTQKKVKTDESDEQEAEDTWMK